MYKVYLVCIAKLENLYVREFVEHYKALNIDKIILYDNNDDHGEHFEEVINDYIQSGFVEIRNVRGINPPFINGMILQPFVYLDAYRRYSKDCDWICYFDIDEFLILDEKYENNIKNFVSDKIFDDFNYSRPFSYENLIYTMVAKFNGYHYERGSKNFDNLINRDIREDFLYSEVDETIIDRFNEYIKQKYGNIQ